MKKQIKQNGHSVTKNQVELSSLNHETMKPWKKDPIIIMRMIIMRINWEYHPLQSQKAIPNDQDDEMAMAGRFIPADLFPFWNHPDLGRISIENLSWCIHIYIIYLMWLNLIWYHQILPDSSPRCHDCQDFCLPLLGGFHWASKPCAEIPSVSSPLHSKWWSRENLLPEKGFRRSHSKRHIPFVSLFNCTVGYTPFVPYFWYYIYILWIYI